ncbi:G8 domain-containing protein [Bremerella sp. P1]|uniref:G8 domain-containing protein n=1 Tax=Bremerella sp. P1 TaxID=3026424 RepID=UPI0023677A98|nr:G8 domain-containing protein [Bremerella sp. P1]WDI42057.1 G8 domain-containing protein [Bremerella sp. P1]
MRPFSILAFAALLLVTSISAVSAAEQSVVFSKQSGPWSAEATWDGGELPEAGDQVVIRAGHEVVYDLESRKVYRLVQIAGTLRFAQDRSTLLNAGLVSLLASEEPTEEGFDCTDMPEPSAHAHHDHHHHHGMHTTALVPTLLIGEPGNPIPAEHTATIRLHYVEGMDKESCPALINCGGHMEIHGQPMRNTWVKMHRASDIGDERVTVVESIEDWKPGDHIIVTGTQEQRERRRGGPSGGFIDTAQTEERHIVKVGSKDFSGGYTITLDKPLTFAHYADDEFKAEVANLTRNVIVESANPDGVRGHTMIHVESKGSISYAEFRHLGKRDLLGRYSLHFHLCGQTMRGSSVIGASIWDSHNRFLTIHGTDSIVVRDCVGYKSVGHGFFLEDGTETNNILDHNLSAVVGPGKPLPKQVVPYDKNRGAGFWFANCHNVFTRNVAAECAEYGYRFENKEADGFNPHLTIREVHGSLTSKDTRVMPFIRFQDNEAHTMRFFCLNLRGVSRPDGGGLDIYDQNLSLAQEAAEAIPTPGYPFWIRNFKGWESNWGIHLGTTGVFVDGLNVFRSDVAIWRSIMDGSGYRGLQTKEMRVNDIHNPLSMGMPAVSEEEASEKRIFRGVSSFIDDLPPQTVITKAVRHGSLVHIEGSTSDTSDVKSVTVNGQPARSCRDHFAQWEITLEAPAGQSLNLTAVAEDVNGLKEIAPHQLVVQ